MATEHICIVEVDIGTESEMKWQKKEHTHASTLTHPVSTKVIHPKYYKHLVYVMAYEMGFGVQ